MEWIKWEQMKNKSATTAGQITYRSHGDDDTSESVAVKPIGIQRRQPNFVGFRFPLLSRILITGKFPKYYRNFINLLSILSRIQACLVKGYFIYA